MSWIVDRLPTASDGDDNGDVWILKKGETGILDYRSVEDGEPWMPAPPTYDPPSTREELVQDPLDEIDTIHANILEAREKLK